MTETLAGTGVVPRAHVVVHAALRSDIGLLRSENQDYGLITTEEEERAANVHGRLFVVADGMGGHRGGATASRLAAETIKSHYLTSGDGDPAVVLHESLSDANARIHAEAESNPDLHGMGTTASALVIRDRSAWIAHVGDSRIYLLRAGAIHQLTEDHSLVASMMREGLLTRDEAASHPRRNVLQRSMGVGEEVDVDVQGPIEVDEGDVFIVSSDGLHGVLPEDELKVAADMPVAAAADEFVRRVLQRGAPDNVTVIVIRAEHDALVGETTLAEDDHSPFDDTASDAPGSITTQTEAAAARHSGSAWAVVRWALLFIALLGCAGAWLYWGQKEIFAPRSSTSQRH